MTTRLNLYESYQINMFIGNLDELYVGILSYQNHAITQLNGMFGEDLKAN